MSSHLLSASYENELENVFRGLRAGFEEQRLSVHRVLRNGQFPKESTVQQLAVADCQLPAGACQLAAASCQSGSWQSAAADWQGADASDQLPAARLAGGSRQLTGSSELAAADLRLPLAAAGCGKA